MTNLLGVMERVCVPPQLCLYDGVRIHRTVCTKKDEMYCMYILSQSTFKNVSWHAAFRKSVKVETSEHHVLEIGMVN